jgi:tetratricopeptide (TPR) repeat protein
LSSDTSNLPVADRQNAQSQIDAARAALALAHEMLPDHPAVQLNDALILVDELRWAEAEAAFRERLAAAGPSDYAGNYWLGSFLVRAGRARQGLPFLERARQLDPLEARPVVDLAMAYDTLGDYERAVELDREAQSLNGYGDASIAVPFWRAVGHDGIEAFEGIVAGEVTGQSLLDLYEQRDEMLVQSAPTLITGNVALTAAALGDSETAMRAWARTLPRAPAFLAFTWMPLIQDVRRDEDFPLLMSEIGLSGYWRQNGWPEQCGPIEPEGFACD